MVKSVQFILFCVLSASLFTSCRPDVIEPFEPYGPQDDAIYGLLTSAIDPKYTTDSIFISPQSAEIRLKPTQFGSEIIIADPDATFENLASQPVRCRDCASLKIRLREAMTEDQLVANGFNLYTASAPGITETSGAINLEVWCDGNALRIRNGAEVRVIVPSNIAPGATDLDMYTAVLNSEGRQIDWSDTGNPVYIQTINAVPTAYEFNLAHTGWNIGFKSNALTTKTVCLSMDTKYNDENTFAYLIVNDTKLSQRMQWRNGQFCLDGVTQGVDAQVFIVSRLGDAWHAHQQNFNTSAAAVQVNPTGKTEAQVVQMVQDL